MHLSNRNHLFLPLNQGGLGLRPMDLVNKSLLAKQVWRVISTDLSSILATTLGRKYIDWSKDQWLRKPYNTSWLWNDILKCSSFITNNLQWQVGSGSSIPINHPLWWPVQGSVGESSRPQMVSDLLTHPSSSNYARWNIPLVRSLYHVTLANSILSIPVSLVGGPDSLIWTKSSSGSYTTKAGYAFLFKEKFPNQPATDPFWKFLWSISLPQKQLLFIWKLLHQTIPSTDVLRDHHLTINNSCHFGCSEEESIHHLFFSCPIIKAVWFGLFPFSLPLHLQTNDLLSWLKSTLFSLEDNEQLLKRVITFLNVIWRRRNLSAHGGRLPTPHDIIRDCISTLSFSLLAMRPQDSPSSLLPPLIQQDIDISSQWHVLVK